MQYKRKFLETRKKKKERIPKKRKNLNMLPIPIQQLIPKNGRSFVSKVLGQPLTGISRWQVARQRTGKCIRAQCARAQCTARLLNGRGTLNRSRAVKLKKGRNCIAEDRIFSPFPRENLRLSCSWHDAQQQGGVIGAGGNCDGDVGCIEHADALPHFLSSLGGAPGALSCDT